MILKLLRKGFCLSVIAFENAIEEAFEWKR